MSTKVTVIRNEGKLSYNIKVETKKESFMIPVIDVRDGEAERRISKLMSKGHRSKFMPPSFSQSGHSYQVSRKK